MREEIKWFNETLNFPQVHGRNILAKLNKFQNLSSALRTQLPDVIGFYKKWKEGNEKLEGYSKEVIKQRVDWLNKYKKAIESVEFSAQSKFHSSVVEEFLYYLFKDLLAELNRKARDAEEKEEKEGEKKEEEKIRLGGIRAYSNLYFAPEDFISFIRKPSMKINEKDQDFAIYKAILIKADSEEKSINVPVVSIECKTYIDKTMLEGSIATAEKIKSGNPYCLFIVVTEWYDVSYAVDPVYSRIDQIYVLRKQKRRSETVQPINFEVAYDLFSFVRHHLERSWSGVEQKLLAEGKIL